MRRILLAIALCLGTVTAAQAQELQAILQSHADEIAKPSRKTVNVALEDLIASGLPSVPGFLEAWVEKSVWQRDDGRFFIGTAEGD